MFSRATDIARSFRLMVQFPSTSTEKLVLPRHSRCVLSCLRCNGHSLLLGSYLSRTGRIENRCCSACGYSSQDTFISFCTVQLRSLYAAHSLATLCLFTNSSPDPGELPGFWGSMVFRHAPSLGRGRVNTNNNNNIVHSSILCIASMICPFKANELYAAGQ